MGTKRHGKLILVQGTAYSRLNHRPNLSYIYVLLQLHSEIQKLLPQYVQTSLLYVILLRFIQLKLKLFNCSISIAHLLLLIIALTTVLDLFKNKLKYT